MEKDGKVRAAYVILLLRDLRALVRVGREGVADLEFLGLFGELLEELLVDAILDKDTRARAARLAMVPAEDGSTSTTVIHKKTV